MAVKIDAAFLEACHKFGVKTFRHEETEISFFNLTPEPVKQSALPLNLPGDPPTGAAVLPVQMEIPHHPNEVVSLLRTSDEDLVDRLFPEQQIEEA